MRKLRARTESLSTDAIGRYCLRASVGVLMLFLANVVLSKVSVVYDWDLDFVVRTPWIEWSVLFSASGLFTIAILLHERRTRRSGSTDHATGRPNRSKQPTREEGQ